jgi:hypothetical protein
MKKTLLTGVAALFLATGTAYAADNDTEIFFKACKARSEDKNLKICEWYIVGVLDGFAVSYASSGFHILCAPEHITTGQTIELIVAWIINHPQDKQYMGAIVIARALKNAFPCPEKSK